MEHTSKIIIKKYPNRRLYNTQTSTYVKLEDLASMVKKDELFIVLDAKSNDDITRFTLVQIILDHESKGYELMPEEFIKLIIKFYGHPMNKLMQDYVSQTAKNFNISMGNNSQINLSKDFEKLAKENLKYFSDILFGKHK